MHRRVSDYKAIAGAFDFPRFKSTWSDGHGLNPQKNMVYGFYPQKSTGFSHKKDHRFRAFLQKKENPRVFPRDFLYVKLFESIFIDLKVWL